MNHEAGDYALSQTDEAIRRFEKSGEIDHVVGSQSMLSQELYAYSSQPETVDIHSTNNTEENHTSMAKRLGLLTEQEETEEDRSRENTPKAPIRSKITIRDTPVRQSECFGSLLDAIKKVTEDEHVDGVFSLQPVGAASVKKVITYDEVKGEEDYTEDFPKEITPSPKRKRKTSTTRENKVKQKNGTKKENKKEQENQEAQEKAKRAALLAEQVVADPEMAKKLLLSMALVRENPRASPESWPKKGSVVLEGFFWAHYPPLEMGKSFSFLHTIDDSYF
jgi:hypothetical protein